MAGRVWFGIPAPPDRHQHDPYGRFTVEIAEIDHPITAGLADFDTTDELYTCLADADVPITVLAEATSKVDGKTYPMAFVLDYHRGRVFHCVLGHNVTSLSGDDSEREGSDGPARLIRQGTAWTARLEAME
jgi:hypothetical protein